MVKILFRKDTLCFAHHKHARRKSFYVLQHKNARLFVTKNAQHTSMQRVFTNLMLCKSLTDYRTASLCQTGRNKHISAMLLKEFESATNFKEDFFKVVEFLHYLEDEGYDMKTFERVKRNL